MAGSIRRQKPEVKDIEIVAIPQPRRDLFGNVFEEPLPITARLAYLESIGKIKGYKNGLRYKQFALLEYPDQPKVDLFLVVPPAQWGSIFTIRTGSAEFSKWIMTPKRFGGSMPGHLKQRDGALWNGEQMIETPTEQSYFEALGIPWVRPELRVDNWKGPGRPSVAMQINNLSMKIGVEEIEARVAELEEGPPIDK